MNSGKAQLKALTGMRFFLALWVLEYHQIASISDWIGGSSSLSAGLSAGMTGLLHTGYSAVSAFFVLSGFVLAYNYDLNTLRLPGNLRKFAAARLSRIYPAYIAGLLLLVPFAVYRLTTGANAESPDNSSSFVLNALLLQAWFPHVALTWNYPGWSLSNEAFFYAILPFIGFILVGRGASDRTPGAFFTLFTRLVPLWLISCAFPVFAVLTHMPHFGDAPATRLELPGVGVWANIIRYDPLLRLPEFLLGVGLVSVYRSLRPRFGNRGYWFYIPGIILSLAMLSQADHIPYPLMHNCLGTPAYALIIVGFALGGGPVVRFLSMPALVFLGNASYSMYILHEPIYAWLGVFWVRILAQVADGPVWFACYVLAAVAVPCVFFATAEEPVHRWLRSRLSVTGRSVPAAVHSEA